MLCQWIQLYEMEPEDFQTILRSFMQVFPSTYVDPQGLRQETLKTPPQWVAFLAFTVYVPVAAF